jgi:PhnB protein
MVKPIPEGYHSITPYLAVKNAGEAIDWYKKALGASEVFRFEDGGKVAHAEIKVGDSIIMLSDEWPEGGHLAPSTDGSPVSLMLYVDDVDTAFKQAIDAGAKEERAVKDQFYGDRSGTLSDPFGHRWHISTHVEDVDESELQRRMEESKAEWKQSEPA